MQTFHISKQEKNTRNLHHSYKQIIKCLPAIYLSPSLFSQSTFYYAFMPLPHAHMQQYIIPHRSDLTYALIYITQQRK